MIAYFLSFVLVVAIHADIAAELEAAYEPASLDGLRGVQYAVDEGERLMDTYPPASCYAEWWALERSALAMLAESLRAYTEDEMVEAQDALDAASVGRYHAARVKVDC